MNLEEIIKLTIPDFRADSAKIHLACYNGVEETIDVYTAGRFEEWQRWQRKRNFRREYVISLISIPASNTWLFAGLHRSSRKEELRTPPWNDDIEYWYFNLEEDRRMSDLNGRLVISFPRTSRQSYLLAERWIDKVLMSEILPKRLTVERFPGFKNVHLTKQQLDLIVLHSVESWKTALYNVAGVYLITDKLFGKLYVGSATGDGGIWQRWEDYSRTGHGGNIELKKMIEFEGTERASHFCYSVLEIADTHTSCDQILLREAHWKNILQTRKHGLNAN